MEQRLQHLLGDRRGDVAAEAAVRALDGDGDRDLRVVDRREGDEPRLGDVALLGSISAVPVLPATSMPWSAAAVPVPSLTTWLIICATAFAVVLLMTRAWTFGSIVVDHAAVAGRRSGR